MDDDMNEIYELYEEPIVIATYEDADLLGEAFGGGHCVGGKGVGNGSCKLGI